MTDEALAPEPEERPKPRRADGRKGRSLVAVEGRPAGRRLRIGILIATGVVTAVLLGAGFDALAAFGRVHPGVLAGGVEVGGMGQSRARGVLEQQVGSRVETSVTAVYGARRWTIKPTRISASFSADRAVADAYAVGRTGSLWKRIGDRALAWVGRIRVPVSADADPAELEDLIAELHGNVDVPPRDAGVSVKGTGVTRISSRPGTTMRSDRAVEDLLAAFVSRNRTVKLTVAIAPPSVSDADAEQAFQDAGRMVSGPVKLTLDSRSWTFTAKDVSRWLAFRKVPFGMESSVASEASAAAPSVSDSAETSAVAGQRMVLVAYVDSVEVSSSVLPLVKGVGRPAVDARFSVADGKVTVIPSQVGSGVDPVGLAYELTLKLKSEGERMVVVRMRQTQPALSTEQARAMGIKDRISSYTTDYDGGNRPRVNNIHTLAKALDGKLVPPGGVFSFNGAVGERTAERGYKEAPAIVGGRLVPQLGGGICQIGTTFFNAVFFSGLPVVERTNHSFYISHYPKGRDATVNWGGPDFKFKNDTASWVLIKTGYGSDSITISLYGTDPGYKVEYTTGAFTNLVPFKIVEEKDPTLEIGKRVVKDPGVDGRKVVVVRTVTLKGVLVRKDTFVSDYNPKDEIVKVGTKPKPSTTPTPTPGP